MEKVIFTDPDTKEKIEFYVLEETQINGNKFLFVTEEEDGDSDAYILKEIADEKEDAVYEMVEDEKELAALGKVFAELIEDADIEFQYSYREKDTIVKNIKIGNGNKILKKKENITDNIIAEDKKETVVAAEEKPARRPVRRNTGNRKRTTKTDKTDN